MELLLKQAACKLSGTRCSAAFRPSLPNAPTTIANSQVQNLIKQSCRTILNYTRPYDWKMQVDINRRKAVEENWNFRGRLHAMKETDLLPLEIKDAAAADFKAYPRRTDYIRTKNRCVISSRPRAVFVKWRLTRFLFRHLADYNYLSGTARADWLNRNNKNYFAHLAPDLHNTLAAIQPVNEEAHKRLYDMGWEGKLRRPLDYNQNVFKTEEFVYPPIRTGDRRAAFYGYRAREDLVQREKWVLDRQMGGKRNNRVRLSVSKRPEQNIRYKRQLNNEQVLDKVSSLRYWNFI